MVNKFEKFFLGKTSFNDKVYMFTINSRYGSVKISSYGASVQSILVPDRTGNLIDVALGFDNLSSMENQNQFIGSTIGRCANRIKEGLVIINGTHYKLGINEGHNHLHGGNQGFHSKVWTGYIEDDRLIFERISRDGEEGYPGNLKVKVIYDFDDFGNFSIHYYGETDKDTILNITNHTYFNLSGHNSGKITDHLIRIFSSYYQPINEELLPNGDIVSVKNTPMDFNSLTPINKNIDCDFEQIKLAKGFDHNYILDQDRIDSESVAIAISPKTGVLMEVFTDMPGMQFYTGNNLRCAPLGKENTKYDIRDGFCMELQHLLERSKNPISLLKAGSIYSHYTKYKFSVINN